MSRKKKHGFWYYFGRLFVYFFKAIYWIFKGLFIAIAFLFRKGSKQVSKSIKKRKEKAVNAARPKFKPKYSSLTEIKTVHGDISKFESHLLKKDSLIGIVLGARGSGKSAVGMKLLENFKAKTGRYVCAMGFKAGDVPDWINVVENVDQIPNNAVVLIDEGGITFSSRKSMSNANQLLSELLMIARHKSLTILFITQNSSNLEVNVLRQADFLILKPSSLLQKDFERKIVKKLYEDVADDFSALKDNEGIAYVHSDKFRGFVSNELPSFWSTDVSKSFK